MNIGDCTHYSLPVASRIHYGHIDSTVREVTRLSVEVPLEDFPPRFVSVLFDDILRKKLLK